MVRHIPAFVVALAFTASSVGFAQTPTQDPAPVRVGGNIRAPKKIKNVEPVYPALAQSARKEGLVILELLVSSTGTVQEAKVIKSEPLLDQAALDAVRQWEYEPTLLNGVPVAVLYNVVVTFSLADTAGQTVPENVPDAASQPAAQPAATAAGDPTLAAAPGPPPVRVGGLIRAPTKIVSVDPIYPADALAARLGGIVILELLVAPEGYVQNANVLRSVPGLDQAALDAVYQWVYVPTLLNGVPVPVLYNVTVSFTPQP
jgi:TonB family protein